MLIGPEEEWALKPMLPDETSIDESEEIKKVKFEDSMSRLSCQSYKDSVISEDLFAEGVDDILYEGELMKFKPGFSQNFVSRYVQISLRAFRYFRNQYNAIKLEPIVAFRKRIIDDAVPYKVNKASYLKPGSAIAQSGKEDALFDNLFEIKLNDDYEDNYLFRDFERAVK